MATNSSLNTYSWLVEDPRDPNYVICKEHSLRRSQANGRAFARWRKNKPDFTDFGTTHILDFFIFNFFFPYFSTILLPTLFL